LERLSEAKMSPQKILALFTSAPRRILGLPQNTIAPGAVADLHLFDNKQNGLTMPTRVTLKATIHLFTDAQSPVKLWPPLSMVG
jgi:hypothetical protein